MVEGLLGVASSARMGWTGLRTGSACKLVVAGNWKKISIVLSDVHVWLNFYNDKTILKISYQYFVMCEFSIKINRYKVFDFVKVTLC